MKPLPLLLPFVLLLTSAKHSFAQHETDHWICGNYSFLAFGPGKTTALPGSRLRQLEGSAVVSDAVSGRLLFYSDGQNVWDSGHQLMPNGERLKGSHTSTQSALIVPFPGHDGQYFLFSVKAYDDGPDGGLYSSLVDINLRNGLGDVTEKNQLLERQTTEKLTAVPHANGHDYWIISHAWNSDVFLVYLLTSEGITESKRIAIGSVHQSGPVADSESMGYLKASPNGKMLAAAVYGVQRPFELFDFDAGKGDISNVCSLGNYAGQYGVSFSPDNSKVYLTGLYPSQDAWVFDLKTGRKTVLVIEEDNGSGKTKLTPAGALQLGIDGKLYSSFGRNQPNGSYSLAVLTSPNGSDPAPVWLRLPGRAQAPVFGLPNFMQAVFNSEKTRNESADKTLVYPNPVGQGTRLTVFRKTNPGDAIRVFDATGKEIPSGAAKILPDRIVLDTSSWPGQQVFVIQIGSFSHKVVKN
ncbi:T9SS type A sorting domain-containing protein [Siphonobacter aquaeclarae]|nr:T9SS type A sorting domain-containing protein [Siphonobacter aquaeclarae]